MTARFFTLSSALFGTLLCALSLGGRLFYLMSYLLMAMLLIALGSVLSGFFGLSIMQQPDSIKAERGKSVQLLIDVRYAGFLPLAPLDVKLSLPEGESDFLLETRLLRSVHVSVPCPLRHVGAFRVGVQSVLISDVFGLFRFKKKTGAPLPEVLSLPRAFDIEKLSFPAQDDGQAVTNRSGEDVTSPEDTRLYREGDPLKRIHWKLSQRAGELIVRKFEVPAPPDTLILMDCTDPVGHEGQEDGLFRLRDTLCETALSSAKEQMQGHKPVRVPLYSVRGGEFHADNMGHLALLKEELAAIPFGGGQPFCQILNLELRRMRRTGASIVITTRLNADIVEAVNNIRRSGPSVRFYFVCFDPDKEEYRPFIARMQRQMVEVCYVTPA